MVWFAVGLLLPMLAAYSLVIRCDRETPRDANAFMFRVSLAVGMGMGFSSGTYFLWRFFVGEPGTVYQICELTFFSALALFWLVRARPKKQSPVALPCESSTATGWYRLLGITFVAGLGVVLFGALGFRQNIPLGDCDAYAIWDLRARTIFFGGDQWRDAFSPVYQHTDYPILLPCSNARLWSYLGKDCLWAPWLLGNLFTFAMIGVLAGGMCRLRDRSIGLLAGIVLVGIALSLQKGTAQYAELPLAFFFLSTVLLLVLYNAVDQSSWKILALSGVMAGMAAWTKNEGLLFLVVVPTAYCLVTWRRGCTKKVFREILCWSAGVLPILVPIVIQKVALFTCNDIVKGQSWSASVARLTDPSRYWLIAQTYWQLAVSDLGLFVVALPLGFLFLGKTRNRPRGFSFACAVLLLMLAGYFLVFLVTPYNLDWHVKSARRLFVQLWPLALLIYFLYVASPEKLLARESGAGGVCEAPPASISPGQGVPTFSTDA